MVGGQARGTVEGLGPGQPAAAEAAGEVDHGLEPRLLADRVVAPAAPDPRLDRLPGFRRRSAGRSVEGLPALGRLGLSGAAAGAAGEVLLDQGRFAPRQRAEQVRAEERVDGLTHLHWGDLRGKRARSAA